MKDAYYFSHDSNARFDPKILKLRAKYGLEGYGFYFCLLEIMRDCSNYLLNKNDFETIAYQLNLDIKKAEILIKFCVEIDLISEKISEKNNFYYSKSFLERMAEMNTIREKRKQAGSKGGSKTQANFKQNSSKTQALKESKVKESKVKEIKENNNIFLLDEKKQKIDPYFDKRIIEIISEYKNANKGYYQNNSDKLLLSEFLNIEEDVELWLEVIRKSANKGHISKDGKFIKLSFKNMLNNYSSILNDSYNLVDDLGSIDEEELRKKELDRMCEKMRNNEE